MESDSLSKAVCRTIKALRLEKEISQEELALLADLDRSYVSGIERQQRNITFSTLEKLIPHITDDNKSFFERLMAELEK